MGYYNVGQVCLNGHPITGDIESGLTQPFCSKCGEPTIMACPNCGESIHGSYCSPGILLLTPYKPSAYCHSCGKPYPWIERGIIAISDCIREDESFSQVVADKLVQSLPDIVVETPATNLALIRVKKALSSVGKFTADALRQFVVDFGCELAKRSLLP